jgi:hypothetical protein
MPPFVRKDSLGRKLPKLVRYSDDDPRHVEAEQVASDVAGLGPDSLSGYGAVEIKLSKLLGR